MGLIQYYSLLSELNIRDRHMRSIDIHIVKEAYRVTPL